MKDILIFTSNSVNEFQETRKFLREIEELISQRAKAIERSSNATSNDYVFDKYNTHFPQKHRESVLISATGMFEFLCIKTTEAVSTHFSMKFTRRKKGKVENAFDFYRKNFPDLYSQTSEEQHFITMCSRARNIYAHNLGFISVKDRPELYEFVVANELCHIESSGRLIVSSELVDSYLKFCSTWFMKLQSTLIQWDRGSQDQCWH